MPKRGEMLIFLAFLGILKKEIRAALRGQSPDTKEKEYLS